MIAKYFLTFLILSILGWIIEMFWTKIVDKKVMNRGFLVGPYCPIYGLGGLLIIIFLKPFKENYILLFFASMVLCATLEYIVSVLMEKKFKARWWDYSNLKYNINGRICLETMIPFGLLGWALICFVNPGLNNFFDYLGPTLVNGISIILFILFILDIVVSLKIISSLKIENSTKDSTETISNKVKEILLSIYKG